MKNTNIENCLENNMSPKEIINISQLEDVLKIGIVDSILKKSKNLSYREYFCPNNLLEDISNKEEIYDN